MTKILSFIVFFFVTQSASMVHLARAEKPVITVGSKVFTESYILAEIISEVLENTGEVRVNRKFGLGGTGILAEALEMGSIDLYPEYSGTVAQTILKKSELHSLVDIQSGLSRLKLLMSGSLGFNNTYALAVSSDFLTTHSLHKISELLNTPEIRLGLSHEFMERNDGYRGLAKNYGLNLKNIQTLEHSLAYEAISQDEIDATDAYSTDAKIERFHLKLLVDDKNYFPEYFAVILAREDLAKRFPKSWQALRKLENSFTEAHKCKS